MDWMDGWEERRLARLDGLAHLFPSVTNQPTLCLSPGFRFIHHPYKAQRGSSCGISFPLTAAAAVVGTRKNRLSASARCVAHIGGHVEGFYASMSTIDSLGSPSPPPKEHELEPVDEEERRHAAPVLVRLFFGPISGQQRLSCGSSVS